MKNFNVSTLVVFVFGLSSLNMFGQSAPTETPKIPEKDVFSIDAEFRPRTEFRDGYRTLPNDTTTSAIYTLNRSRIYVNYQTKGFIFHTSIQDIRLWGQTGQFSAVTSLGIYETYVEPTINKNLSLRIGRQALDIDNNRLFSPANWNQAGRAHEGLRLFYKSNKLKLNSDVVMAFNQSKENVFNHEYTPLGGNNYKALLVHNLKYSFKEKNAITTLYSCDGYQNTNNWKVMNWRATVGGRYEYTNKGLYLTTAAYLQYGTSPTGKTIKNAFYIQPEIKYSVSKNVNLTLGAEIMSGDDATNPISGETKSFNPLYGVAHKFMGYMDYFTTFPNDLKNGGLINPYFFKNFKLNKKMSVSSDMHLFYSQNKVLNVLNEVTDPLLGFEHDLSLKYKFNDYTTLDCGFSYMLATESMEVVKGGSNDKLPIWSMAMITFKPKMFNHEVVKN